MDDGDKVAREAALALTKRSKFVYVTTVDQTGFPETRVMFNLLKVRAKPLSSGAAVKRDFANYIGTNTSSKKVAQMRKDDRVCLYYSDNLKFEGCMVRGRVVEVTDAEIRKAVWTPSWKMYYYGGIDGGDFSLLAFEPETVKYYHGLSVREFPA
jgi:general stress protein 26